MKIKNYDNYSIIPFNIIRNKSLLVQLIYDTLINLADHQEINDRKLQNFNLRKKHLDKIFFCFAK